MYIMAGLQTGHLRDKRRRGVGKQLCKRVSSTGQAGEDPTHVAIRSGALGYGNSSGLGTNRECVLIVAGGGGGGGIG